MPAPLTTLVIPCFNEASRLELAGFARLLAAPRVRLLFVDDGSTDATVERLGELAAMLGDRVSLLRLDRNVGKAEAVRRGLVQAMAGDTELVGYTDADLATPPEELLRLRQTLIEGSHDVAIGSRVQLLGCQIERDLVRHYVGRIFATGASLTLGLPVYDTQCGAKLFRRTAALETALSEPFASRWAFDVELLGRLHRGTRRVPGLPVERFVEMPLRRWRDVPGSKVRPWDLPRSLAQLVTIRGALRQYLASDLTPGSGR